jgi:hypothetical protein
MNSLFQQREGKYVQFPLRSVTASGSPLNVARRPLKEGVNLRLMLSARVWDAPPIESIFSTPG